MWSEPDTVGGGVSMEKTSSRVAEASKRYVPASSQAAAQRSSSPSRAGLSGTRGAPAAPVVVGVDMIALPYLDAAPARHRDRNRAAARAAHGGQGVVVRLRA